MIKEAGAAGCANLRLSVQAFGYRSETAGLFSNRKTQSLLEGNTIMQRIMLGCAALLFLASPLRAQPASSSPSITEQAVPPPETSSPSSQPASDLPPFIPPPRARLYDNYRPAGRHHAQASHNRVTHHRRRAHHSLTRHHHASHRVVRIARSTVRRCHAMTYYQIMRHGTCRELMRRELRASASRHHHASHRHGTARHHR